MAKEELQDDRRFGENQSNLSTRSFTMGLKNRKRKKWLKKLWRKLHKRTIDVGDLTHWKGYKDMAVLYNS